MRILLLLLALLGAAAPAAAETIRIKDIGKMAGWRENALNGYGLVTGLAGTGDSARNKATRQSIANMLSRFVRGARNVSDDVQRQLKELASCG